MTSEIIFLKEDLLSSDDIGILFNTLYVDIKAKTITNKLKKYVIIYDNNLYLFNQKYINKGSVTTNNEILMVYLLKYICESLREFEKSITRTQPFLLNDSYIHNKIISLQNLTKTELMLIKFYLNQPEIFADTETINDNDNLGVCFEKFLIKTNDDKKENRLTTKEICEKYSLLFGEKITNKRMLNELKQNGFKYEANFRKQKQQGCFINVKFKEEEPMEDLNSIPTNENIIIKEEPKIDISLLSKKGQNVFESMESEDDEEDEDDDDFNSFCKIL